MISWLTMMFTTNYSTIALKLGAVGHKLQLKIAPQFLQSNEGVQAWWMEDPRPFRKHHVHPNNAACALSDY